MNVMEIYRSVQGEGTLMGVPTTFVRFFACNLRCAWCFVPDTPVLMADWSWRRLGDLTIGDTVLGVERPDTPGSHQRLVKATVEYTSVRLAPTVTVNDEVRCTPDHKFWLTGKDREKRSAVHSGWREVERAVGMRALFVTEPAEPSERACQEAYTLGYLAGMADGDGTFYTLRKSIINSSYGHTPHFSRVIEAVEPTGLVEPVVTLTTSCGSYIAGGYVVKNCDTKYSWSVKEGGTWEDLAPEQVAARVGALGARHVVLTGGEPTLQRELGALAGMLKAAGHHLTVETNTTVFPEAAAPLIDLWSLSPKLVSAGRGYLRYPVVERFLAALRPGQQQWKFVVRDDDDEAALRAFLERYPAFAEDALPLVLQPEGDTATPDYPAALGRLAERLRDPFWDRYFARVLPQMHVIVWGRRRWV
jgi:7-carboxy-7-deazaguanine synthase